MSGGGENGNQVAQAIQPLLNQYMQRQGAQQGNMGSPNKYQNAFMNMQGPQSSQAQGQPYQPSGMNLYRPQAPQGDDRGRSGADWANPGNLFSDNMGEQGEKWFGLPSKENPMPSLMPGIPGGNMFGGLF